MNPKSFPACRWLLCLGEIMNTVRRKGLLAIEVEVSMPASDGSPFRRHPPCYANPISISPAICCACAWAASTTWR